MEPLSFQEYILSLDIASLPRVLKVCSGVYFQGSVYEVGGRECCLSTGDLIKITGLHLQKITCEDPETGQATELPLNFKGHFQPSRDKLSYMSLKKLVRSRPAGLQDMPFAFASAVDLTVDGQFIPKGQPISLLSVARHEGQEFANCTTMGKDGQHLLCLPFSFQGQFCECSGQPSYTLSQVLESEAMRGQRLKCSALSRHSLLLCPVYEVQAIMHMRKEVVKIPSTLEVDVEDVTEESQHTHFIKPLMLSEVLRLEGAFPMQAEILEGPEYPPIFENDWIPHLQKGQKIQIHGKSCAWRILASSSKGRRGSRHFLLSNTYQGKFRRRPREFPTVFDLTTSLGMGKCLRVVVTKDCESTEEDLPSLSMGDRLEVLHLAKTQVRRQAEHKSIEVLLCSRSSGEDEESEQLMLPLDLEGGFVEEVSDSRRYSLPEIVEQLQLPCEVKVTTKDSSLANDILGSFSALRLEARITEPFLVTSLCEAPSVSFQIPPQWLDMALFFTEEPAPPQTALTDRSKVEELTESFYYHLLKLMPSNEAPPPRPPKRKDFRDKAGTQLSGAKEVTEKPKPLPPLSKSKRTPEESVPPSPKPRNARSRPIVRSSPNEYSPHRIGSQMVPKPTKPFKEARDANVSDGSDHDYELIDDIKTTDKMQKAVLHY
ncbi:protein THEMIS2 [Dermochelys coriacea]|uniref:protein THEMIS2 n=1 Tax=Dermochelys coriacea TaxID=27794 RepID=UPI0018E88E42|nr:protein THEMIS2 [Dermochelys coriacea]